MALKRITFDPNVMGGKPCIRGMRVTVGMIVGLVAAGYSTEEILAVYPYLEPADVRQALNYAAGRVEEARTSQPTALIDELLLNPIKIEGFTPLTRDEAHARD